ncbi:sensor histidine kinase [Rugosimonospora africana]|nr:histidine kinase [Rugosimonospora africana]
MTQSESRPWTWRLQVRSLVPLVALDFSIIASQLSDNRIGWATILFLVLVSVGWLSISFDARPRVAIVAGPLLLSGAGIGLAAVTAPGVAITFPAVACFSTSARNPLRWSVPFTVAVAAALAGTQAAAHHGTTLILVSPAVCIAALLVGLIRRQNNALAEETRLARENEARSAALDERARIAREIHDVLAHSLAALTVQLETADALLETGRTQQAQQSIHTANQLAREGLAETRRAISALRGDTLPLPDLLANLAAAYHTDFDAPATTQIDGQPYDLTPDTHLALYRTAQEAVTNVRKHAPGAAVAFTLAYRPRTITLTITNDPPPPGTPRSLTDTGGGYGLTGLRERAELAGGTFTAGPATKPGGPEGPAGAGWRVEVQIPS